eukprot:m.986310 g.986310  ORF g.986310 m.986310 type:complete len:550 (-) comp23988_c0_seq26:3104-4753(-)
MMGNSTTRCQPRTMTLKTSNYIVFQGKEADDFVKERGGTKHAETDCGALSIYWHGKCIGFATALSETCMIVPTHVFGLGDLEEDALQGNDNNPLFEVAYTQTSQTAPTRVPIANIAISGMAITIGKTEFLVVQLAKGILVNDIHVAPSEEDDIIVIAGAWTPGDCGMCCIGPSNLPYFLLGASQKAEFYPAQGAYNEGILLSCKYVLFHIMSTQLALGDMATLGDDETCTVVASNYRQCQALFTTAALKKLNPEIDMMAYVPLTADTAWIEWQKRYKKWMSPFSSGEKQNIIKAKSGPQLVTYELSDYDAKVMSAYITECTEEKILSSGRVVTRSVPWMASCADSGPIQKSVTEASLSASSSATASPETSLNGAAPTASPPVGDTATDTTLTPGLLQKLAQSTQASACWYARSDVKVKNSKAEDAVTMELSDFLGRLAHGKKLLNGTKNQHFNQCGAVGSMTVDQPIGGKCEQISQHPLICRIRTHFANSESLKNLQQACGGCCRPSHLLPVSDETAQLHDAIHRVAVVLGKSSPESATAWWDAQLLGK